MTYRVLIVDDEPINRLILSSLLEELDYALATAENGREALAELSHTKYDAVLLDLDMPEVDGYQVLVEMRQNELLGESLADIEDDSIHRLLNVMEQVSP